MKESVEAARSYVRSKNGTIGIPAGKFTEFDIHIHVPEGAIPKDGPSAGVTMCTALASVMTGIPARSDVAMTGEVDILGNVTEIGGLKEKLLAALRAGVKTVVIPEDNRKDLAELPEIVRSGLKIVPVDHVDRVLEIALTAKPKPLSKKDKGENKAPPKKTKK